MNRKMLESIRGLYRVGQLSAIIRGSYRRTIQRLSWTAAVRGTEIHFWSNWAARRTTHPTQGSDVMLSRSVQEREARKLRALPIFLFFCLSSLCSIAPLFAQLPYSEQGIRRLATASYVRVAGEQAELHYLHRWSASGTSAGNDHFIAVPDRASIVGVIVSFYLGILLLLQSGFKTRRSSRISQRSMEIADQVLELLTTVVTTSSVDMAESVRPQMERIMESSDVDDLFLFMDVEQLDAVCKTSYVWRRSEKPGSPAILSDVQVPPTIRIALLDGKEVLIENVSRMSEEMQDEKEYFDHYDVRSCIGIPVGGTSAAVRGALVGLKRSATHHWSPEIVYSLRIVAGSLAQASMSRLAESALRESESRFRKMADCAPFMIWMADQNNQRTFYNRAWLEFAGRAIDQQLKSGGTEDIYADDRERYVESYKQAFDSKTDFSLEYRLRRFDGEYRWVQAAGVPRFDTDGRFLGYIGSCLDVDESKRMHDALSEFSGRLIAAQEEERFRIARELHDDLNQRMALVLIRLEQVRDRYHGMPSEIARELTEIAEIANDVSESIHQLSRELHPSRLDHVGLGAALGRLCREMSEQYGLQIEFMQRDLPPEIPRAVAVCLYRVSQEALTNIVKHSGAKRASVALWALNDQIELRISDSGCGFDSTSVDEMGGLGLLSMRERLRLVGGEIHIISHPMRGTEIQASVPLSDRATQVPEGSSGHSNEELPSRPMS